MLLYCPTVGVSLANNGCMYRRFARVPRIWDSTMREFKYELAVPSITAPVIAAADAPAPVVAAPSIAAPVVAAADALAPVVAAPSPALPPSATVPVVATPFVCAALPVSVAAVAVQFATTSINTASSVAMGALATAPVASAAAAKFAGDPTLVPTAMDINPAVGRMIAAPGTA